MSLTAYLTPLMAVQELNAGAAVCVFNYTEQAKVELWVRK
jgi:hypothetical protein